MAKIKWDYELFPITSGPEDIAEFLGSLKPKQQELAKVVYKDRSMAVWVFFPRL